jgi:hypothetical protein
VTTSMLRMVPRRTVQVGLAATRLPLTAVETVIGRRDSGWFPATAYTGFEAAVLQVAGGLLGDQEMAAAGRRKQGATSRLQTAAELDAQAEATRAKAEQTRRRQVARAESTAGSTREHAEERRADLAERESARKVQIDRATRSRQARAARRAEETEKGRARRQRARDADVAAERAEALEHAEAALDAQEAALDLGETIEKSREARTTSTS